MIDTDKFHLDFDDRHIEIKSGVSWRFHQSCTIKMSQRYFGQRLTEAMGNRE